MPEKLLAHFPQIRAPDKGTVTQLPEGQALGDVGGHYPIPTLLPGMHLA